MSWGSGIELVGLTPDTAFAVFLLLCVVVAGVVMVLHGIAVLGPVFLFAVEAIVVARGVYRLQRFRQKLRARQHRV